MSVVDQNDVEQVWGKVRDWPQPQRVSLASKILQSLEAEQERSADEQISGQGSSSCEPRVVNRGDGPKIEGTRITVYAVLEFLKHGHSKDWIADWFRLSHAQVQAAMDYIRDNEAAVNAAYERIMARIAEGNPPEILAKFEESRKKMKARLAELRAAKESAAR
jgi:uncharacterized protein (DUF433 family)